MIYEKKKKKALVKLEERIAPYSEFWYEWIHSPGCNLTKSQIDAIVLYQHYQDFKVLGEKMECSTGHAFSVLNRALNRLTYQSCIRGYRAWVGEKLLIESGAYDNFTELEKFLSTPIHYFHLPTGLEGSLSGCGDTLGDVLKEYGEKELLRLRNFGEKKLNHLKKLLKQNNALKLLKKQVQEREDWYLTR